MTAIPRIESPPSRRALRLRRHLVRKRCNGGAMNRELHIVGFQVGRETYGVPIASLHEIVRITEITSVPDSPDYIEDVINLRGKIVSVIDLRKHFRDKESGNIKKNRILVVESHGRLT